MGTRDAVGVLGSLDHNKDLYMCCVDYEKAFDRWI